MPPILKTESKFFIFLVGLSATLLATWAAVFSVTGLSMLYSGSMLYVAIAMGVLEFSKIIVVSYLYRHWRETKWWLKAYLSIALILLMLITSGGVYGYLINSYQGATVVLDRINSTMVILEQQKKNLEEERKRLIKDIAMLREDRQSTVTNRNDEINSIAIADSTRYYDSLQRQRVYKRYDVELKNIDNNINKYVISLDSTNAMLLRITNQIAENKLKMIDTGIEVGPLIYMARIFNTPMDNIMKWFTMVIVFVFDPLAIALILALNVILVNRAKLNYFVRVNESEVNNKKYDNEESKEKVLEKSEDLSFLKNDESVEKEVDFDKLPKQSIIKEKPSRPRFSLPNSRLNVANKLEKESSEKFEESNELKESVVDDYNNDISNKVTDYTFSPKPEIESDVIKDNGEIGEEVDIDFDDVIYKQEPKKIDPEEQYNNIIQHQHKELSEDEIKEIFEDSIREARKNQLGKKSTVIYEPGGKVTVDHTILDQEKDVDFAKQE